MIRSIVFLCLALLASFTPASAKSFASGADVILIAGIAGDVETESEYEEIASNLMNWLKSTDPAPASVTIFADMATEWTDDRFPIQKLEAKQLALKKFIESRKNNDRPLVCFLWGHGGEQKGTPVFHVKGPRIEPADLESLKNAWPNQPSFWTLAFRHSGSFSKALAADLSQSISSEGEVVYNSDPLLMRQASRVLRENPNLSFEDFAKDAAKKVDTLYKENGVARTEDPIFWNGKEPPAYLISKDQGNAFVEAKPEAPRAKPVEAKTETAISNESKEIWETIQSVDPKRYPEDDAIFLSRSIKYVLGGNPAIQTELDQFIQILTPEGADQGDITLSYAPPGEILEILDCEVRKPDGTIIRLPSSRISDAPSEQEPGYISTQKKSFSFPEIVAGSILRLHYRRSWKNFPLPHLFVEANLGMPIPAIKTDVEIKVSKSMVFNSILQGIPEVKPEIETSAYGKRYKWRFDNLPAQATEILSPPESGAKLQASTFPDWDSFAGWYERLIRLADTPNDAIKEKAAELTKNSNTELEKVEAIYNYVTALRYVMIPLGVNSHRPHSAENTFRNQYGDCKDKANLFNTMLRTQGIEAYLVLVPRFTQADERMPGMAFNHAISQVRLKDRTLWIDTTDPICRFGMLPPGDPGRKVLVIDGKSRTLDLLPYPDPEAHVMRIVQTVDLSHPTDILGTVRADPRGYSDYILRAAGGAWGEKSAFPVLSETFLTPNGTFALDRQNLGAVSDLAKETWWEGAGKWSGLLTDLDESGRKQIIRAPIWLPKEWAFVGNRRTSETQLNKGYPLRLDETVKFKLPKGAQVSGYRKSSGDLNGLFKWTYEWRSAGKEEIEVKFTAELSRGDLTKAETEQLSRELNRLSSALSTGPILQR